MRIKLVVILLILVSLVSSACSSPTETIQSSPQVQSTQKTASTQAVQKNQPANISTFGSAQEGGVNRFYFLLGDSDGRNVSVDGHVQLQIFDDSNSLLYSNEIDVKASEYVGYQFKLTGQDIGKAYEWRVATSDIKKGVATIGWGRAVLSFTTLNGKTLTAENKTVQIPTYTDDELKQIAENDYELSATQLSLVAEDDNFILKLTRYGHYTYYSFGKQETIFRVDISVTSKKAGSFYTHQSNVIDADNKQYEVSYKSEFESGQLAVGVTKVGYVAFEDVPLNSDISKIIVADYVFDIKNNRGYTFVQISEEEYNNASTMVDAALTKGNFSITILRAGFFSSYEYGERKEYFRIDMEVSNVGNKAEYFLPSGLVLLDNQGNQYEKSYGGSIDVSSQIYPNVTKKGYILFEGVPSALGSAKLVFQLGHDAQYNQYYFEFAVPVI